jgi:hypothetical protein
MSAMESQPRQTIAALTSALKLLARPCGEEPDDWGLVRVDSRAIDDSDIGTYTVLALESTFVYEACGPDPSSRCRGRR